MHRPVRLYLIPQSLLYLSVATRFQQIPEDQFNANETFIVKESKAMNFTIGLCMIGFAVLTLDYSLVIAIPTGIFGIASIVRSGRNFVVIKIDRTGFYYYGKLVTTWKNFASAKFIDDVPVPTENSSGVSDRFFLAIRYYKDGNPNCFERKVAFTNTQDKSEEEILAAIKFYYKKSLSN